MKEQPLAHAHALELGKKQDDKNHGKKEKKRFQSCRGGRVGNKETPLKKAMLDIRS